jgi:hypothetical protein
MYTENLQIANGRGWPRIAADEEGREMNRLSYHIIGAGQKVSRTLGVGFLEKVYENALALELRRQGLQVEQQWGIRVFYSDEVVGVYSADLLVESKVIVELKALRALEDIHRQQCVNYLRATRLRLCLLMNFGRPRMEFSRVVRNF